MLFLGQIIHFKQLITIIQSLDWHTKIPSEYSLIWESEFDTYAVNAHFEELCQRKCLQTAKSNFPTFFSSKCLKLFLVFQNKKQENSTKLSRPSIHKWLTENSWSFNAQCRLSFDEMKMHSCKKMHYEHEALQASQGKFSVIPCSNSEEKRRRFLFLWSQTMCFTLVSRLCRSLSHWSDSLAHIPRSKSAMMYLKARINQTFAT